jgi:hypothetical protein
MIAIHGSKDYILPETLINASCGASFSIPSWLLAILEERSLQLSLKNVQFASCIIQVSIAPNVAPKASAQVLCSYNHML